MHLAPGTSLTDLKVGPFLVWRSANISTINLIISPRKAEWFHCVRHSPPPLPPLNPSPSLFFFFLKAQKFLEAFLLIVPQNCLEKLSFAIRLCERGLGPPKPEELNEAAPPEGRGYSPQPTAHSQAARFHTISMHPNPKENCSKFHPSQRAAVTADSNAGKRGLLYLLVGLDGFWQARYNLAAHTDVQDSFSLLSWGIWSVLLLAARLWKEASGQNKYF